MLVYWENDLEIDELGQNHAQFEISPEIELVKILPDTLPEKTN
jgi:hypothetical protein